MLGVSPKKSNVEVEAWWDRMSIHVKACGLILITSRNLTTPSRFEKCMQEGQTIMWRDWFAFRLYCYFWVENGQKYNIKWSVQHRVYKIEWTTSGVQVKRTTSSVQHREPLPFTCNHQECEAQLSCIWKFKKKIMTKPLIKKLARVETCASGGQMPW